ncbi:MAG TPA: hypothetical protein VLE89_02235 [Chlamydiales bacterium]|nr:hypothetical protein [Chlamydiales bacterium]
MFLRLTLISLLALSTSCSKHSAKKHRSQLDHLIAPEVKNDALYDAIYRLSSTETLSTILEIGSSSGEGSTAAFVSGIKNNPHRPTLACVEVSKRRFAKLQQHYINEPQVRCYNVSSVPLEAFPQESDLISFYENAPPEVIRLPLSQLFTWLKQDIEYLQQSSVPQRGIELIKQDLKIDHFDMVLIDGSEFTGRAELDQLYGAKFILLDDVLSFKNHSNRARLLSDPRYALLEENLSLRHGYSIFRRSLSKGV